MYVRLAFAVAAHLEPEILIIDEVLAVGDSAFQAKCFERITFDEQFFVLDVLKNGTGEPGGTTYFFNLYIYKNFFTFQNMSYGATLAWLLFAISLALTLLLFRSARHWVYYTGEAR